MTSGSPWTYLIVNADDYGYFNCVSQGILESASHGIVTATGIFANSAHFAEHVGWLRDNASLDLGVHLNITDQTPLTRNMQIKLSRWNTFEVDEITMQSSVDWIFAGGDAVLGPQTAAKAAYQGKEAAESIIRYVEGRDLKEGRIPEPEEEKESKK